MVVANSKEHAAVTYAAADEEPLGEFGVGQCEMIPVMYINVINPGNFIGCMAVPHQGVGFINVYNIIYHHENPMIAHHIKKWWSFIPSITWLLNVIDSGGSSDASGI